MTENKPPKVREPGILRVNLESDAAQACLNMMEYLKSENEFLKIHPSQFVSFLVTDYFRTYFDKDTAVLIAEFFDSDSYYESERSKAKGLPNYEEAMEAALAQARAIKCKRRGNLTRKAGRPPKSNITHSNETL